MALDIGAIQATLTMTEDFSVVLAKVRDELDKTGVRTQQVGDNIDASTQKIQSAYNRLASSLDPATAGAIKYTQAHSTLSAALDKGIISHETYTTSLTAAGEKFLTAGTSAQSFRDLIAGVTEIAGQCGTATAELGGKLDSLIGNFSGLGAAVAAMGPLVLPIAAIAAALAVVAAGFEAVKISYDFIKDAVTEGMKTQAIIEQLNNTLRNTGSASGLSSADMIKYADSLQWVSGASKDAIIQGEGMLARFTKIGPDAFKPATQLALDFAQATGRDVPESFKLIGVALEGGQKAFRALVDVGIILDTGQKARLKDMLAMGDVAAYQALMMEALRSKVAGAAAAYEQTLAGSINRAEKELKAAKETIGSEVIPALEDLFRVVTGTAGGWDQIHIKIQSAATYIGEAVRNMVYGVASQLIEWNIDWYEAKASFLSFEEGLLSVSEPVSKFMSNVLHIPFVDISDKLNKVRTDIQDTTDDINTQAVNLATLTLQYNEHRKALEGNTIVLPKVKTGLEDLKAAQKSAGEAADGARAAVDKYIVSLQTQEATLSNSIASNQALLVALDSGLPAYEALKQRQITSDAVTKAITASNKTYQDQLISLDKTLSGLESKQDKDTTHKVNYGAAIVGVQEQIARLTSEHDKYIVKIKELIPLEIADKEAVAERDAALKATLANTQAVAIARAQLADAESRYTSTAAQVTIVIAAQNKAFSELHVMSGQAYDDRVRELTQQAQYIQGLKDQKFIQDQINAATDAMAKLRAQIADTNELNSVTQAYGATISGILSKYGLLSTSTRELNIQTQLRNDLQKDRIAANSKEAQDLEKFIRAQDAYTLSLKATQAQIEANQAVWKSYDATITNSNQQFLSGLNTLIETGKLNFQTFVTQLEDIWLKGIEQMIAAALERNVVDSWTRGLTGAANPGGTPSAQFAAAVAQFGTYVNALTTGSGLGGGVGGAGAGVWSGFSAPIANLSSASNVQQTAASNQQVAAVSQLSAADAFTKGAAIEATTAQMNQATAYINQASAATNTGSSVIGAGGAAAGASGFSSFLGAVGLFIIAVGLINQYTSREDAAQAAREFNTQGDIFIGNLGPSLARYIVQPPRLPTGIGGDPPHGPVGDEGGGGGHDPGIMKSAAAAVQSFQSAYGAIGALINNLTAVGRQFTSAIQSFLLQLQSAMGGLITFMPNVSVLLSADGKKYAVTVGGAVIGFFNNLTDATNAGIIAGLQHATFTGAAKAIEDYIHNAVNIPGMDPQTLLNNVKTLAGILQAQADVLAGAGAAIANAMQKIVDTAQQERAAVESMGISGADLITFLKAIGDAEVAGIMQQRNLLTGTKETNKQIQEEQAAAFNAKLAIAQAEVATEIYTVEGQIQAVLGMVNFGIGVITLAQLLVQTTIILSQAGTDFVNNLIAEYNALQGLHDQLMAIKPVAPGDVKVPGSGATQSVTTLAQALQILDQAALALAQFGLSAYRAALLKIETDIHNQEKGLRATSQAYRDLEQAERDQIALLNAQTQAATDATVIPLIQQAHGISTFRISLATLQRQFDDLYATEKALGAGSAELGRIRVAELQAEHNLVMQIVGALSLPIDTAQANAKKYSDAIEALNIGLADGAITASQWAAEMAQITQKAQADILTMIENIYTSVGDTADAEKIKEQLQQINFEIQLAQLQVMAAALLATGAITQALYDQVQRIEAYYTDPAHQPNWAAINAGASAAASGVQSSASSIASALQTLITAFHTAKDNIMKLYDSLTSGTMGGVAPDKAIAAARAQYDAAMALADTGDLVGLQNAPAAAQAWITALKAYSPSLYDIELPNIEAELLKLGHSTTVHDATTGMTYSEQLQQTANTTLASIGTTLTGSATTLSTGMTTLSTSSQMQSGLQTQMVQQGAQTMTLLRSIDNRLANPPNGLVGQKRPTGTNQLLRAA